MSRKCHKKKRIALILATLILLSVSRIGEFPSEAASKGWKKTKAGWMYIHSDGTYAKSTWLKWKKKHFHFNAKGIAQTGWKMLGGKKYYFSARGVMQTGWKKIKGKWYYFKSSGELVTKTWIGRYYVDAKGVRTKTLKATGYTIPKYYRTQLYDTVQAVNRLGKDWTSFAIITDTHGDGQRTQTAVRYLLEHSEVSKCFWLGDLCSGYFDTAGQKEYEKFRKSLLPCKDQVYVTIGNHDRKKAGTYNKSDVGIVYRDFLKSKKGLKGNPEDFYYYFDDTGRKLRYLVINTSNVAASQMSMNTEEQKWIRDVGLALPGKDWRVVVLGHIDIAPDTDLPYKSKNALALTETLGACNGHVVGYFCGHEHIDVQSRTAAGFYQNALASDCIRKGQKPRAEKTVEDGAVTVVCVNTKTGRVAFRRIGLPIRGNLKNYYYKSK